MKAALALVALAAFATAAFAEGETRTFDVSAITAPRLHVLAPTLGPKGTRDRDRGYETEPPEPLPFLGISDLVELIRTTVDPESWDNGLIQEMDSGNLVARNRPEVLARVEAFLGELAAMAAHRTAVALEVYELPREKFGAVPVAGDLSPAAFAALGARKLDSASAEVWPGVRGALKVASRVRYVADYQVEIAQGSMIADPVVDFLEEGFAAELSAHPTLDGDKVLVEMLLQSGQLDRPMREVKMAFDEEYLPEPLRSPARSSYGTLQLPSFRHAEAFATKLLPSGSSFAVPCLSGDRCVVFVVTPRVLGSPPAGPLADAGALCAQPFSYRFGYPPESDVSDWPLFAPRVWAWSEVPPALRVDSLTEFVNGADPEGLGATNPASPRGMLAVSGAEDGRNRARNFVRAREKELLRPVTVDLRVLSAPAEATEELLFGGRAATLSGRSASIMAGDTLNYLADYDVEVAQEARIADPEVAQSFAGFVANVLPRLTLDGKTADVRLEVLFARRKPVTSFDTSAQTLGTVDIVDERRVVFNTTVEVTLGEPFTIDAGLDPLDPARRVVLRVLATAE